MIVTFTKKFPYAPYLNIDLGAEIESHLNTKEECFSQLDKLNDWTNEWFKTRYGEYEEQRGTVEKVIVAAPEVKQEPKTKEETLLEQIESCSSANILQVFKKIVEKLDNPVVTEAYIKKMKSFK